MDENSEAYMRGTVSKSFGDEARLRRVGRDSKFFTRRMPRFGTGMQGAWRNRKEVAGEGQTESADWLWAPKKEKKVMKKIGKHCARLRNLNTSGGKEAET